MLKISLLSISIALLGLNMMPASAATTVCITNQSDYIIHVCHGGTGSPKHCPDMHSGDVKTYKTSYSQLYIYAKTLESDLKLKLKIVRTKSPLAVRPYLSITVKGHWYKFGDLPTVSFKSTEKDYKECKKHGVPLK